MSSKTSLFNKAIFLSDIKRYWWTILAQTLILILTCVIPLYNSALYFNNTVTPDWLGSLIIPIIFGGGVAILLFSYLNSSASSTTLHSYPITRTGLFFTKLVSAVVLLVSPIIINGLLLMVVSLCEPCYGMFTSLDVLVWIGKGIAYIMISFSLATAVSMMTGNAIAALIFTIGFMFLPIMLWNLAESIFEEELLGYTTRGTQDILQYIYIDSNNMEEGIYTILYPLYSVILLAIAYVLYRLRKMEAHGEIIAFKWLKPVFIGIISILASGLSYIYFGGVMNIESLFTVIPLGIIGAGVSHMISVKALDFKGSLKPIIIYVAAALCFIITVQFDLTGFEKRIPNANRIESVNIFVDNRYYLSEEYLPEYTDKSSIETIRKLHYNLIEASEEDEDNYTIYICYNLKNKSVVKRLYEIDYSSNEKYLKSLMETDEYRKSYFKLLSGKPKKITSISFEERRNPDGVLEIYPDNPLMQELIDGIKKDMKNYTYEDFGKNDSSTSIYIYWEEKNPNDRYPYSVYETMFLSENTVNTNKVIQKLLNGNIVPSSEDILSAKITINNHAISSAYAYETEINTPNGIKEVYELYDSMIEGHHFTDYGKAINVYVHYTLKNGHTFDVSCSYDADKLPRFFKNLPAFDIDAYTDK